MGMTMTQKILADHAGVKEVHAGELIEANVDIVMANDITLHLIKILNLQRTQRQSENSLVSRD